MKKINIMIALILSVIICQAVVSPVYIALPPSVYGVPQESEITFTATLMENSVTYIDIDPVATGVQKDQLTKDSPSCSYFIRSDGYCGIIKIECGNFESDLASEELFYINFQEPSLTVWAHRPVLELSWIIDDDNRSSETIYLQLDGGVQSFGKGANGEWEEGILPVTLASFTASFNDGVPVLQWITASENSNAGWNVFRANDKIMVNSLQINAELIAGQGTTTEETSYIFQDEYDVEYNTEYYYWLESVAYNGDSETYGPITLQIPENEHGGSPEVPIVYGLHSNYPNPFNPDTRISFALAEPGDVSLTIYNVKGQKVVSLIDNFVDKVDEVLSITWDGRDQEGKPVGSGIYFYQLITAKNRQLKKMTLIK